MPAVAPERNGVLSRARASGSHHLPWALSRIVHASRTVARAHEGSVPGAGRERYCSPECRQAARKWSHWKAQQKYRATAAGKKKRNGQSRRYRERVRVRQPATSEEVLPQAARVITPNFFRPRLRPARLLPRVRHRAPVAHPAILFARVPARHGAGLAARTAVAARPAAAVAEVSSGGGR